MKRASITHAAALALAAGLSACSSSEPCPRDQELIDRFTAHEATFERLRKDPDAADLRSQLGIRGVHHPEPDRVHFMAWGLDFVGPGGAAKGYAYAEKEPKPLVESIDSQSNPGSPEQKLLYRRVKGNWYLFYGSSN
jgi:hypothetical protein